MSPKVTHTQRACEAANPPPARSESTGLSGQETPTMTDPAKIETRTTYLAAGGSVEHETSVLSVGAEFLPACALAVLDDFDADPAPAYWAFLTSQLDPALSGDEDARVECARVIADARAQGAE